MQQQLYFLNLPLHFIITNQYTKKSVRQSDFRFVLYINTKRVFLYVGAKKMYVFWDMI